MAISFNLGHYHDSSRTISSAIDFSKGVNKGQPSNPAARFSFFVSGVSEITRKKDEFAAIGMQKVVKPQSSQYVPKFGSVLTKPVSNPISGIRPERLGKYIPMMNSNPLMSFMRGEAGQNIPLEEDAIAVKDGYAGACLNLIW